MSFNFDIKAFSNADMNINVEKSFTVEKILISDIENNPHQPRLKIDAFELERLIESIESVGLLEPIVVSKLDNNKYQLIAGHRRVEAFKTMKQDRILANIIKCNSDKDLAVISITENIQRENLKPLELALAFKHFFDVNPDISQKSLSLELGKNEKYVCKIISILNLSNEILDDLKFGAELLGVDILFELQTIKDIELQKELYFKYKNGEITQKDIRLLKKNSSIDKISIKRDKLKELLIKEFGTLEDAIKFYMQ
jgi:ParB family chromosome partitioning protein